MSDAPTITAIIPVRLSVDRLYDEIGRIERIVGALPCAYAALIVDYGTCDERASELRDLAERTGSLLVRTDTCNETFSAGRARDIGILHAKTELVFFHDVDFLMSPRGYEQLLEEARLRGMPHNAYAFFALPGVYLTECFTEAYLRHFDEGDAGFGDMLIHDGVIRRDKSIYEHHTYAISAVIANRYHLLAIGGHDDSFVGHGAEDFEIMHRLASYSPRGPKTKNYYDNTKSNSIQSYFGFRAYFALYGIDIFQRGLQIAHLWHPRRTDPDYVGSMSANQTRVSQVMRDFDKGQHSLPPRADPRSLEYSLVLMGSDEEPAVHALRHAFPALGRYEFCTETTFASADELMAYLESCGFTQVLFIRPYSNSHRSMLYSGIKAADRRVITCDLGGLHDSWFFDRGGYLAESDNYQQERWSKPITGAARQRVSDWLTGHRNVVSSVSYNPPIGADNLRRLLALGDRKVVFVPFQHPDDPTAVHFAGACQNPDGFRDWLLELGGTLDPASHVIVVGAGPGEHTKTPIAGTVFASADTHILDLIDLADSVVVINSDVGLMAVAERKPVICCGRAYYGHSGLATKVQSSEALISAVLRPNYPDEDAVLRFFHHLTQEFYSFGTVKYTASSRSEKHRTVRHIAFSVIRGLTSEPIELGRPPEPVDLDAPLFFSFGGRTGIKNTLAKSSQLAESGISAFLEEDLLNAINLFEQAHNRAPTNPRYLRLLAEACLRYGSKSEACRHLEQAQKLAPENEEIAQRLRDIKRPNWIRRLFEEKPYPMQKQRSQET